MNLLVVDFDYFFPVRDLGEPDWEFYDWGHSERRGAALQDILWQSRAGAFLAQDLPLPGTSGLERDFWSRFRFRTHARGYVSDSNFFAMHPRLRRSVNTLYLFDAHHDCGYEEKPPKFWDCANWGLYYLTQGAQVVVNYPTWRTAVFSEVAEKFCYAETVTDCYRGHLTRQFDPGGQVAVRFDKVHVCRSGAWVPPWLDAAFDTFRAGCPVPLTPLQATDPRPFDQAAVCAEAKHTQALLRTYAAHFPNSHKAS